MKTITAFLFTVSLLVGATAQEAIQVEARFVEHPSGLRITKANWQRGEVLKKAGVNLISAPVVTTASGNLASIKVVEVRSVPSGGTPTESAGWKRLVETGPELEIRPIVRGDIIDFSAKATIRQFESVQPVGDVAIAEFTAREFYFGGTAKSGETLIVPSKATRGNKRLTLIVTFTKA